MRVFNQTDFDVLNATEKNYVEFTDPFVFYELLFKILLSRRIL